MFTSVFSPRPVMTPFHSSMFFPIVSTVLSLTLCFFVYLPLTSWLIFERDLVILSISALRVELKSSSSSMTTLSSERFSLLSYLGLVSFFSSTLASLAIQKESTLFSGGSFTSEDDFLGSTGEGFDFFYRSSELEFCFAGVGMGLGFGYDSIGLAGDKFAVP